MKSTGPCLKRRHSPLGFFGGPPRPLPGRRVPLADGLVDGLLEAGIKPSLTLFHWDLPAALEDRGGWLNPDIADWFADYASVVGRALGDRIALWATLNEPWVVADGGYLFGVLAPGHRSAYEAVIASRNLLRAHGAGVQALRSLTTKPVGLVVNLEPQYAATDRPLELAATVRAEAYMNRQYLDPALRGEIPAELPAIFGEAWSDTTAADLALIKQPIDFIGINYYTRSVTCHDRWPGQWGRPGEAGGSPVHGDGLGGVSGGAVRCLTGGARPVRRAADLSHRKRRGVSGPGAGRRHHRRSALGRVSPRPSDRRRGLFESTGPIDGRRRIS